MIKKVLIANRGEIACRVIKTAKKMGITTVVVYSEADEFSRHVLEADESILIGPAVASESYLSIEKIIDAVKKTNSDAIHPGYGFLSENSEFVQELSKKESDITSSDIEHAVRRVGVEIVIAPILEKFIYLQVLNFILFILSFAVPIGILLLF